MDSTVICGILSQRPLSVLLCSACQVPWHFDEPEVAWLAERVIRPANRACRVGTDPVFGLDEEGPVADIVANQLGQGGRPEWARPVAPASGVFPTCCGLLKVRGRIRVDLHRIEAIAAISTRNSALSASGVLLTRTNIPFMLWRSVTTQRSCPPTCWQVISTWRRRDQAIERDAKVAFRAADDKPAAAHADDFPLELAIVINRK